MDGPGLGTRPRPPALLFLGPPPSLSPAPLPSHHLTSAARSKAES